MTVTAVPPRSGASAAAAADLESLYRSRYRAMVRLAYAMTGSPAVAEELVQDAFIRVHARFATVENPEAYLHTTVVNMCRSWHRAEARRRLHGTPPACTLVAHGHPHELVDAVAALPPAQRAVVALRFYDDCSEQQIARALGCSTGTVKSNLSRALRNLRKVVEQ